MSAIKTFTRGVTALALGAAGAFATPALADSSDLGIGVQSMEVHVTPPGPQLVVRNIASDHHIGSLNLAIQGNTLAVGVGGSVACKGTVDESAGTRGGYALRGGAYGIGRSSLLMSKALPDPVSIDHVSDLDAHSFQLPVATLANPQIDVDPVAVVLAAAEQAPNKVQWLRQDHTLTVKLPIRWEAVCASYARNKITKKTVWEANLQSGVSYITKDVDLKIKYQGDPHLFALNAKIGESQKPMGFQSAQPLNITSMQFQPNLPHHVGACPATVKFRVNYSGQGKGDIRIRAGFGNTPKHESPVIAFDANNGPQHYDFELETPHVMNNNLNNTLMTNLRVWVRGKDAGQQNWSGDYKLMDAEVWKVRCTPVLNPSLGTSQNGIGGYQQNGGGAKPLLPLRKPAEPAKPARQPIQ